MNSKSRDIILAVLTLVAVIGVVPTKAVAKGERQPPKKALITQYYYETKKPIKAAITVSNPTANRAMDRWMTIPKGTIVLGQPVVVKNKQIKQITIKSTSLSYAVKKTALLPGYYFEQWQDLTGNVAYSHARFKKVAKPKYTLPNSDGNLYLGNVPKTYPDTFLSDKLAITADGYVERYRYDPSNGPEGFSNRPIGMAKITKSTVKGNVRYIYYRTHITGLNDQRVHRTGQYRYRLRLADQYIRTQRVWDGGKQAFVADIYYAQYRVGNQAYYTEVGEKAIDD